MASMSSPDKSSKSRTQKNRKRAAAQKRHAQSRVHRLNALKDKKRNRIAKLCVSGMAVALVAILSVQILQLDARNKSYQEQKAQLETQLTSEKNRTKKLEEEKKYVNSDQYVENEAKSKLGMAGDDEIVFKEK
ncbi:MAG TPA: septum formation initiator family protein [Lachnospiraceae bacterium]|jgi:cell division protein DivIC|uniref:FtsB family cell division protein n=1 Tax=Clostridium sp. (strain SY8519) TaxID=1042156 RepID=UPI0002171D72|nr:septum formation initiator family protein [Clostridium sp. SY8519]BAK47149.1 septum formation initiator [Clostridium sp. SY8519]HAD19641.1 septum formation initiator family protein [Lachnospiraceae bacterium]